MHYGEAVNEFEEFFSNEYYSEVAETVNDGEDAVVVDYQDLDMFSPDVTDYLRDNPDNGVGAVEEGLQVHEQVTSEDMGVRFSNFPEHEYVLIKNLGADHVNKLIAVEGLITDVEEPSIETVSAIFECRTCGDLYEKEQNSDDLDSPYKCDCGEKQFDVQEKILQDAQRFTISSDDHKLECKLEGDKLGSREEYLEKPVELVGVFRKNKDSTFLEVNNIKEKTVDGEENFENQEFLSQLVKDSFDITDFESFIESLDPLKFEKLLAYFFKEAGYRTELTTTSGDKGIDLIARKRFPVPQKLLIQAKYYKEGNKVVGEDVQQYNSLKEQEPNTDKVYLITTSSYTPQAAELAEMLEIEILDREDVIRMIKDLKKHKEKGVIEIRENESQNIESIISEETVEHHDKIKEEIISFIDGKEGAVKIEAVIDYLKNDDRGKEDIEEEIEKLKREGEMFEPQEGHLQYI